MPNKIFPKQASTLSGFGEPLPDSPAQTARELVDLMPLPAARDYVLSVGAGTDAKTLVEQLFLDKKVSEEVKNRLLDDLPALEARARAPAEV